MSTAFAWIVGSAIGCAIGLAVQHVMHRRRRRAYQAETARMYPGYIRKNGGV